MLIRALLFFFALLCTLSLIQPSFSIESPESQFFVQISPEVVTPGQNISIIISMISKQNMTDPIGLNIVAPDGISYRSNLILSNDGDGFATRTLIFPSSFTAASTVRQGVYSVFIQNSTGSLLSASSFKVADSSYQEIGSFFKTSFVQFFVFPGILAFIAYFYQRMGSNRDEARAQSEKELEEEKAKHEKELEEEKAKHEKELEEEKTKQLKEIDEEKHLKEKKSDYYISVSQIYYHVYNNAFNLSNVLSSSKRHSDKQISYLDSKNKIQTVNLTAEEQNNLTRFYQLIRYVNSRMILSEKIGSYFLDNLRTETLLRLANRAITQILYSVFGQVQIGKFQKLLPEHGNISDLYVSTITGDGKTTFDYFKTKTDDIRIIGLIQLLKFYSTMFDYEVNALFADWYHDKTIVNSHNQTILVDAENQLDQLIAEGLLKIRNKQKPWEDDN